MIEKIKEINPSIPGMLVVQSVYLIIGEALILLIADTPMKLAIGFAAGVYTSGGYACIIFSIVFS